MPCLASSRFAERLAPAAERLPACARLKKEGEQEQPLKLASTLLEDGAGERLDVRAATEVLRWDAGAQAPRACAPFESAIQSLLRFDLTVSPRLDEP
jgi:hypothetical protein